MVNLNEFKEKLFALGVGTAQLDQDYGFDKKPSEEEQKKFINKINESPINLIDTAPAYANAEKVLGKYLSKDKHIVTKLKLIPKEIFNNKELLKQHIVDSLNSSLKNLNVNKIEVLLMHQTEPELIFNEDFKEIINEIKKEGKISFIGVSLYEDEILKKVINDEFYEAIEINFSIIDQRKLDLVNSIENKLVIARSVFLRGMLTCPKDKIPEELKKISQKRDLIEEISKEINVDYKSILLNYPLCTKGIDIIILGMTEPAHIDENLLHLKEKQNIENNLNKFKNIEISDENIVDPRKWGG